MSLITSELLKKLAPATPKSKRDRFLPFLNEALPRYQITTPKRIAAFLATCCYESDYFRATEEYASGWAYDKSRNPRKAKQLGNTEKGDGPKYKGRGLIQLTGKANYEEFDAAIVTLPEFDGKVVRSVDVPFFDEYPELLKQPLWAVESACWYWRQRNLNKLADSGSFKAIQGIVNRGDETKTAKDYKTREKLYNLALSLLAPASADTGNPPPESVSKPSGAPPPIILETKTETKVETTTVTEARKPLTGRLSDVVTWLQGLADRSAGIEGSVSRSSWAKTILGWVFALVSFTLGFIYDNPVESIIGGAVLVAIIWYFSRAKDRENDRKLFGGEK